MSAATSGDRVGFGVVGAGAIGIRGALMHLSREDVQDRVYLAAVCDTVPGRAEAAAREYGVARHYTSYEELLADGNVDAVTLCTPIGLHFQQGLMAIEAGKHVHFNKTMTTRAEEAGTLIEKAATEGAHLVASPGMMLHPYNRRIRKTLLEGRLGQLVWAITGTAGVGNYHMKEESRTGEGILTSADPTWYFKKPGGGPQYDVTVYCLHTLTGIVGPALRVSAMSGLVIPERDYHGKTIDCEMDDSTMLTIDFGDTFYSFVYGTVAGRVTSGFQPNIYGTQGSIVGTMFGESELKLPGDHQPHVTGEHLDMPESHVFEDLMQLADGLRGGKRPVASGEHARHVVDIIEAGYRAAETGQTQDLTTTFEPLSLDELSDVEAAE